MTIYLGADHRGFKLKQQLIEWLRSEDFEVEDLGATKYVEQDDYPDYALAVAEKVAAGQPSARGIVICHSGVGVDIAANKVRGIRAALINEVEIAQLAREDDDINILALAAGVIDFEQAKRIVQTFLKTKFTGLERHLRRIEKIKAYENRNDLPQ